MPTEYTYSIDRFLHDSLPQLPGANREVALRELRLAIWEFFERSYAWTEVIEDTPLETGDTLHQISAAGKIGSEGGDATVLTILDCSVGTASSGFELLTPLGGEPLAIEGSNTPPVSWYIASNADTLKVHPYYTGSESLMLRTTVAVMPLFSASATGAAFPRQFESKWYDAILDGFLARMYMHPRKPYSQPVMGSRMEKHFSQLIGYYAAQRKKGYNNSQQWSHPLGWSK